MDDLKTRIQLGANWIAQRELLFVLALLPWLLFPDVSRGLTWFSLALLPLFWVLRRVGGRPLTIQTPLNWALLLLLACLGTSVWYSPDLEWSTPQATAFLAGVALYFAVVNSDVRWRRPEYWGMAFTAVAGVATVLALIGTRWATDKLVFLGYINDWLPDFIVNVPEAVGDGFHPNLMAGTLALLLPAVLAFVVLAHRRSQMPLMSHWQASVWLGGMIVGLMCFVIILTQSRTTMVVVLAIASVVAGLRWRPVGVLVTALLFAATILFLIGLLTGSLSEWLIAADAFGRSSDSQPSSWLRRTEIWQNALNVMRDYPLTGCGLGTFAPVTWLNYVYDAVSPSYMLVNAHNLWFQAGVDFGVVGLLSFGWLSIVVLLLGWKIQQRQASEERILMAGVWLGLIAWLGHGVFHAISLGSRQAVFVWAMLGLLVAIWIRDENGRRDEDAPRSRELVRGLLVAAVSVFILLWILDSRLWALNRGALLLDTALLPQSASMSVQNASFLEILDQLEAAGDLPGVVRRKALTHYAMGNSAQAKLFLGQDVNAAPYLVSRGRQLLDSGALEPTQNLVLLGLDVVPESGRLTCVAADAFRLSGSTFKALRYYRQVPERANDFNDMIELANCYYQLGTLEGQLGWWDEASEQLQAAVDLNPSELQYRLDLGWSLFQATGELSQAVAVEEAALELEPDSIRVMLVLVDIYLLSDRPQKAMEWLEQAVELDPDNPVIWLRLAQAHRALDQFDDAQQALDESLRLDATNAEAIRLQLEWVEE